MSTGKPFIPDKATEIAYYEDTGAIITENHTIKDIDDGLLFRNTHKYEILSAGVAYMLIKVGAKFPHTLLKAHADGNATIEFYHSPEISADGPVCPSTNFNLNSSNTPLTAWHDGPTVTDPGVYIANTWILGGSGVATPSGSRSADSISDLDVVLTPTVEFLLKFTNTAGRNIGLIR